MSSASSQSRKSMAIWATLVLGAVLLVAVLVYGVTRPASPSGQPQSAVVVSHYYLERRSCGGNVTVATVRLRNGDIVRAGAAQADILRNGMHVTVEKRNTMCVLAPYTILPRRPPNNSFKPTAKPLRGSSAA